jgi:hypothetical protein
MESAATTGRRLRDVLAGLFEEAFRLERRRRRGALILALLVGCIAAGGVLLPDSGDGGAGLGRVASAAPAPRMALGSETLPRLGENPLLSVGGNRLVVSDTDNTTFAGGHVHGTCTAATLDPTSLRVTSVAHGSCGDPALFAQHVIPIVYVPTRHDHPGWGVNPLAMRISVLDRSVPAGYRVGPVIVTYPDGSDMRAETIEGDDSLWVYAPVLAPQATDGELLRVSLTTGQVVERWRMPSIFRALLATNANGLWLAPSNESGFSENASAVERLGQGSLYHVSPGVNEPTRVFDVGGWGARWLVAHGDDVWLARGPASRTPTLWRFEGAKGDPTLRGARTAGGVRECGDLGDGPVTVMGSAGGILCVSNPNPDTEHVQWLGASGGRSSVVANIPTGGEWEFVDNAVLDHGAYYFVEPTPNDSPQSGRPILYRVAPR